MFKITRALPGNAVSAKINFPAARGLGVQFDPTKPQTFGGGTAEFKKATGTRAFFLERDVLSEADFNTGALQRALLPMDTLLSPEKVGTFVTARAAQEIEVESLDLVLTSGTGAISSGTAAGTELSFDRGKLRVKQSGDELAGWLREQITPEDSGNVVALRVEFAQ